MDVQIIGGLEHVAPSAVCSTIFLRRPLATGTLCVGCWRQINRWSRNSGRVGAGERQDAAAAIGGASAHRSVLLFELRRCSSRRHQYKYYRDCTK